MNSYHVMQSTDVDASLNQISKIDKNIRRIFKAAKSHLSNLGALYDVKPVPGHESENIKWLAYSKNRIPGWPKIACGAFTPKKTGVWGLEGLGP